MTGVTAAIAEAPHTPVPTPISVRRSPRTPSRRPIHWAATRHTVRVTSVTGSESAPARSTWPRESRAPRSTTAAWSTRRPAKSTPGRVRSPGRTATATSTPSAIPATGPPTTGRSRPTAVAAAATARASARPGSRAAARGAERRGLPRTRRRRGRAGPAPAFPRGASAGGEALMSFMITTVRAPRPVL